MRQKDHGHQTKEWEDVYLDTRRNTKTRKKRLLKFGITSESSVLDLGCGDGLNVSILLDMGIKRVVGVDISKFLLSKARKNNPSVKFSVGKAGSIPFKAKRFDVVLVDSVLHHLMKYTKPVKEIRRVLVDGGVFCFIEPHSSIPRKILDFVCFSQAGRFVPGLKNRQTSLLEEKQLYEHWLKTEDIFFKTLEREGFSKIFCKKDFLSIVGKYRKT